jgi:hypothetical protein
LASTGTVVSSLCNRSAAQTCRSSRLRLALAKAKASNDQALIAHQQLQWDCPGLVDTLKLLPEGATDAQNTPAVFA